MQRELANLFAKKVQKKVKKDVDKCHIKWYHKRRTQQEKKHINI